VLALTAALDGVGKRQDTANTNIANLTAAQMKLVSAVLKQTEAINKNTDETRELRLAMAGYTGTAENVIVAGKLTVDAAARTNEALERTRERLEHTGEFLTMRETVEVTIAPHWSHRALDRLWPYAEHSAQRIAVLALTSMGAGAAVLSAVKAFITWVL
jgi:hypothetical protein